MADRKKYRWCKKECVHEHVFSFLHFFIRRIVIYDDLWKKNILGGRVTVVQLNVMLWAKYEIRFFLAVDLIFS